MKLIAKEMFEELGFRQSYFNDKILQRITIGYTKEISFVSAQRIRFVYKISDVLPVYNLIIY